MKRTKFFFLAPRLNRIFCCHHWAQATTGHYICYLVRHPTLWSNFLLITRKRAQISYDRISVVQQFCFFRAWVASFTFFLQICFCVLFFYTTHCNVILVCGYLFFTLFNHSFYPPTSYEYHIAFIPTAQHARPTHSLEQMSTSLEDISWLPSLPLSLSVVSSTCYKEIGPDVHPRVCYGFRPTAVVCTCCDVIFYSTGTWYLIGFIGRPRGVAGYPRACYRSISWVRVSPSAYSYKFVGTFSLCTNWLAQSTKAWVSNIRWKSMSIGNAEPYAR